MFTSKMCFSCSPSGPDESVMGQMGLPRQFDLHKVINSKSRFSFDALNSFITSGQTYKHYDRKLQIQSRTIGRFTVSMTFVRETIVGTFELFYPTYRRS